MQKRKGDIVSQIYNKMEIEVNQEITDIITAVQNDSNSRYLDVVLLDGGAPLDLTGEEVRIYMKKPDGTEIFNDGEITDAAAGRCQFLLTTQALGAVGVMHAQISIWKDNTEILTTQAFHIYVAKSLISEGSVESSNEYGALVVLFQNLYQALDLMTDMVAQIGQTDDTGAGTTAGTVNGKLNQVQNLITDLDGDVGLTAKEATLNNVGDRIGQTADTGGSSAAGTVMGKLNNITELGEEAAKQSTLSVVSTRMGATTDTGGSTTAGTVMGKLNAILVSTNASPMEFRRVYQANIRYGTTYQLDVVGPGLIDFIELSPSRQSSSWNMIYSLTVDNVTICSNKTSNMENGNVNLVAGSFGKYSLDANASGNMIPLYFANSFHLSATADNNHTNCWVNCEVYYHAGQ